VSFQQINPTFSVMALSGDVVLIQTISDWDLEGRIAEQLGCSGSEARMSLGAWLEFTLHNYQYVSEDC
jgi:hypothetical protein